MESQKRNGGCIKACRIHDLLHDFCLRKAVEENEVRLLNGKLETLHVEESRNLRRLCVYSNMEDFMELKLFCPRLRSLSFFRVRDELDEVSDISFIFRVFKLLRVLDMETLGFSSLEFPGEVGLLVLLRYLTVEVTYDITPSIGNLCNLETLIIVPEGSEVVVTMPDTFWNLQKMRHLYLRKMQGLNGRLRGITLPIDKADNSPSMLELDTLSGIHCEHWGTMEKILRKFPKIRRLKFWLSEFGDGNKVMSFSFLTRMESLTLSFKDNLTIFEFIFPESIKQLNLSHCGLPWERISGIAKLPNLEVLKLLNRSFIGEEWQMEEGEFSKLRFLKLMDLELINWTGCDYQFPSLEKLVVERCDELEEIPDSEHLENDTFEVIEVIHCPDRVECLFKSLAHFLMVQFHVRKKVSLNEEGSINETKAEDHSSSIN